MGAQESSGEKACPVSDRAIAFNIVPPPELSTYTRDRRHLGQNWRFLVFVTVFCIEVYKMALGLIL